MKLYTEQRLVLCHSCAVGADKAVKKFYEDNEDKDDKKGGKKDGHSKECECPDGSGKRARKA